MKNGDKKLTRRALRAAVIRTTEGKVSRPQQTAQQSVRKLTRASLRTTKTTAHLLRETAAAARAMNKRTGGLKETMSDHLPLPCDHVDGVAGSALEQLSVSALVRGRYARYLEVLELFIGRRVHAEKDVDKLDTAVVEWANMRAQSERPAYEGTDLMAAIEWRVPAMKGKLVRARRAVKGWMRLMPRYSRTPLAEAIVHGIAVALKIGGLLQVAHWVLMAHGGYFRPGELYDVRGDDVVPPIQPGGTWAVVIRPMELGRLTKTGAHDDSILWDSPSLLWMTTLFPRWRKAGGARIWDFEYAQLKKAIENVGTRMGLKVAPYVFRHSGPSADALEHRRCLTEIQKRGRWRTAGSLARYEKAGKVAAGFRLLRPCVRRWCLQCSENLEEIMLDRMPAPKMFF